jgi:hypothetical protein
MKTVNLRRFSDIEALREISPRTLVALMDEHREFLATKGLDLPPVGEESELDYQRLATVFLSPDDIPHELVERFHMVKQMSGPAQMDKILDTVRKRQLEFTFPADSSPEDVAAHLLLHDQTLFQELYAEKAVARYRSFVYYVARRPRANFQPPASLTALERTLNGWYEAHQRARSARVFWRMHRNEFWFNVRHAEPIKRDGCVGLKDCKSGSTIYRPERHDLVIYDATAGELRVHADCDGEAELFRLAFGMHLFGDGNYFPASKGKYTLEPLRVVGRRSLVCAGIDGLLGITLKEIEFRGHGELGLRENVGAADVFSVFEARRFQIPTAADIRLARFSVQFRDARKARSFTLRPSNYATFSRDDDAMPVQAWLERQGFVLPNRWETKGNENWNLEYS